LKDENLEKTAGNLEGRRDRAEEKETEEKQIGGGILLPTLLVRCSRKGHGRREGPQKNEQKERNNRTNLFQLD